MNTLKSKILLFSLIVSSTIFSQDGIDNLIKEVQSGYTQIAIESLPDFKKKYPDSPSVIFLDAMLDQDQERSIKKYKQIYTLYEDSKYADDAIMKIAEFYYTNGSYIKSSEWVKKINLYYSKSEHINRSLNLYIRTLVLTGKEDTAKLFFGTFKKKYPNIKLEKHPKLQSKEEVVDNDNIKGDTRMSYIMYIQKMTNKITDKLISSKISVKNKINICNKYLHYKNLLLNKNIVIDEYLFFNLSNLFFKKFQNNKDITLSRISKKMYHPQCNFKILNETPLKFTNWLFNSK